mgnify:CR=1 FL=1
MKDEICVNRKVITDMTRLLEEMQDRLESLELASDSEIMESLKKSEKQIKNREFADWNEL